MNTNIFIQQLDAVLKEYDELLGKHNSSPLGLSTFELQAATTKAISAIHRASNTNSIYVKQAEKIYDASPPGLSSAMGIVRALRDDLKAGYIQSLVEIVHSNIFADFLEMAQHLCDNGYKDAAAVIVGSTLESHLRSLCEKSGIAVEITRADGSMAPKKADTMNSELATAGTYSKIDQKSVTAWLGLRNKAAHGEYSEYSQEQVALLVSGVRDFIVRNPA
jgi:hypothetical protein